MMAIDIKRLRGLLSDIAAPVMETRYSVVPRSVYGSDGRLVDVAPLIDLANAIGPLLLVYEAACAARDRSLDIEVAKRAYIAAPDEECLGEYRRLCDARAARLAAFDAVDAAVDKARGK